MSTAALDHLGAVKANVRKIAAEVEAAARGAGHNLTVIYGYNPASKPEHSAGTALDFMVYGSKAAGDWVANYLWTHRARLGLRWEIWYQRIRSTSPGKPGSWQWMANRGSTTQNHKDHVHANFVVKTYVPLGIGAGGGGGTGPAPRPKPKPRPTVDLSQLVAAAKADPGRKQSGTTAGSGDDVKVVEAALVKLGYLAKAYATDGSYGSLTREAYSRWQRQLGYRGNDANGIPGKASLTRLGQKYGFGVKA